MITTTVKKLSDYYGHQKQSTIFFKKEGRNIRKEWTLEYCDDQGKFERVGLRSDFGGLDIDDAYHERTYIEDGRTESFDGIVIETYLHYLFNPKILDVKLWEQIYDGDELLQERWFEFPVTFVHEITKVINKAALTERDSAKETADYLKKENEELKEFLQIHRADKAFKEWREERRTACTE